MSINTNAQLAADGPAPCSLPQLISIPGKTTQPHFRIFQRSPMRNKTCLHIFAACALLPRDSLPKKPLPSALCRLSVICYGYTVCQATVSAQINAVHKLSPPALGNVCLELLPNQCRTYPRWHQSHGSS